MSTSAEQLADRVRARDRRALAQMISRVEAGDAPPAPAATSHPALVVGITGSGGAGKSTLVAALVEYLRQAGKRVAVLACDPQSPLSGGALLGDRVRMTFDPADDGVYFRSLSTRGAQGGVSAAVGPAIDWLKQFGFDVILIETVGVGQDQIAVRPWVDRLVLVVTPASGDEVQWEKAGLIELADVIAVNKADMAGADRVAAQLVSALTLDAAARTPPVLRTVASSRTGIDELWQAVVRTQ